MSRRLNIYFDSELLEAISSEFDLRTPNKEALRKLVFTLDGSYDPDIMQVLNLATGVGKTYLMAAFIEYLRRQGVGQVVIVTPGKTVQHKTVQNFTPGSARYISGSAVPPNVVTPQDYSAWVIRENGPAQLSFGNEVPMLAFVFNIQQLVAPKSEDGETHGGSQDALRRKPRRFDENAGVLFDYLKDLDDLVVIADESHLYSSSAASFHSALQELNPAATIGLTASPSKTDKVVYRYPLYQAIKDKYVKVPVLAFRKNGYGEDKASEEQQLRDALQLRSIKQAYYDAYATEQNRARLNAVAFVVCSDVDHATQVADLLRTPEYLGKDYAVLQVDSKHEDDATQRLLENLDRHDSPVLAVVSVNKLKEGWDVANIAVVVTLRAMASGVLTQQTMGRGLRLPFGKYTGILQIDQLDIISHRSFRELLSAENVLEQFGLEGAIENPNKADLDEAIRKAADQGTTALASTPNFATTNGQGLVPVATAGVVSIEDDGFVSEHRPHHAPGIGIRSIDDDRDLTWGKTGKVELVFVGRNPRYTDVTYMFPATSVAIEQTRMFLSDIDEREIERSAHRVTSSGEVLYRKEIIAALGKDLRLADTESAEVDSVHISAADAQKALVKLVLGMQVIPKTEENKQYAVSYLVPKFMGQVSITHWTLKSLTSAKNELQRLLHDFAVETLRRTREITSVHPKKMPGGGYSLPLGERIYDPVDTRDQFVRGRVYSGWFKSLFEAESFDSFTGEYELARLLNTSPHIVWWHRLRPSDRAAIYYSPKDRYFPDFVALDDQGIHWIIEGKDERGRDDARVQAKRKAAEALVRRLAAEIDYAGQRWGYLIAYETDTVKADSWDDLKSMSQPVTNAL